METRIFLKPSVFLLVLTLSANCLFFYGQLYHHLSTPTPLSKKHLLVLGFMGGREPWDNEKRGVRKLALKLRSLSLSGIHVETIENKKRDLALELIHRAFDHNQNGILDPQEKNSAQLILYGQSFGGAAVVKLAHQLKKIKFPVLLTVQIDSIGIGDAVIPSNVVRAANLFQGNGLIVRGESKIYPEDSEKTEILGNFEFDYSRKKIDLSQVSWFKKLFRTAHTKMDFDPEVWEKVEKLILSEIHRQQNFFLPG